MRLVCPNCDAEYEVDDAAIPREGRDVQCSNCGHAWFQVHPELEAATEAEAELHDPPVGAVAEVAEGMAKPDPVTAPPETTAPPAPTPQAEPEVPAAWAAAAAVTVAAEGGSAVRSDEDDGDDFDGDDFDGAAEPPPPPAPDGTPLRARSLDETVLAVLREEAEREVASRRAEATQVPVLESQTEMPLAAAPDHGGMAAAVQRIARMRGVAAGPAPAALEAEPEPAKSRGQMFPAIEEINSTLRATGHRGQDQDDAIVDTLPDLTRKRGGFGRGFVVLISLAVVIVALYLLAPVIAVRVPELAGAAGAYVAAVDAARVWLDANLRSLVTLLRGMAGQGG